jgi:septum formation protein
MADTKYVPAPTEPPPSYSTTTLPIPTPTPTPTRPPPLRAPLPLDLPILTALRNKRVILASASPRRKQLLAQIGLSHIEIIPSTAPENLSKSLSPFEYVLQTATQKCQNVYESEINNEKLGEPALVIAADTVVISLAGAILEKPRSEAEHIAMLESLRDSGSHKVYTAVVAMAPLASARHPGFALENTVEETTVRFGRDVSDEVILAYVKTREGADKAGGYGIQGIGSILVERIEGSFDNVVGLPVRATLGLIGRVLDRDDELEDEFAEEEDE